MRRFTLVQVPVPAFRELLWEQLLAPFFCFQVRLAVGVAGHNS